MDILAHRGFAREAPPNTLSAFSDALQAGCGIEVDLRITGDNRFVVTHDPTLSTETQGPVTVRDTDLSQLQDQFSPAADREPHDVLPTLEDILREYASCDADTAVALHLKDVGVDGVEQQLVDALTRLDEAYPSVDVFETVFVFDVLESNARTFHSVAPELRVALSIGDSDYFPSQDHPTVYRYEDVRDLSCWDTVWADEWRGGHYSETLFESLAADGRDIYAVSPELHRTTTPRHPNCENPRTLWQRLADERIDGICTDSPLELHEFVVSARQ